MQLTIDYTGAGVRCIQNNGCNAFESVQVFTGVKWVRVADEVLLFLVEDAKGCIELHSRRIHDVELYTVHA